MVISGRGEGTRLSRLPRGRVPKTDASHGELKHSPASGKRKFKYATGKWGKILEGRDRKSTMTIYARMRKGGDP